VRDGPEDRQAGRDERRQNRLFCPPRFRGSCDEPGHNRTAHRTATRRSRGSGRSTAS